VSNDCLLLDEAAGLTRLGARATCAEKFPAAKARSKSPNAGLSSLQLRDIFPFCGNPAPIFEKADEQVRCADKMSAPPVRAGCAHSQSGLDFEANVQCPTRISECPSSEMKILQWTLVIRF
jgi:hypothetical protein